MPVVSLVTQISFSLFVVVIISAEQHRSEKGSLWFTETRHCGTTYSMEQAVSYPDSPRLRQQPRVETIRAI